MDLKKAVDVALAERGITKKAFANDHLHVSRNRFYNIMKSNRLEWVTLEHLASALNMKVSELIALGED